MARSVQTYLPWSLLGLAALGAIWSGIKYESSSDRMLQESIDRIEGDRTVKDSLERLEGGYLITNQKLIDLENDLHGLGESFCMTINQMHRVRGFEVLDCTDGRILVKEVEP